MREHLRYTPANSFKPFPIASDNIYVELDAVLVFSQRKNRMSPDARFMCGLSLILIPTIVYGGLTILSVISGGHLGTPGPESLSPSQIAFYRAGHAHAGVLTLLALFIQVAVDYTALPRSLVWPLRIGAIAASILVSGGFFATVYVRSLRFVLYTGAALVAAVTLTVGIGLIRSNS